MKSLHIGRNPMFCFFANMLRFDVSDIVLNFRSGMSNQQLFDLVISLLNTLKSFNVVGGFDDVPEETKQAICVALNIRAIPTDWAISTAINRLEDVLSSLLVKLQDAAAEVLNNVEQLKSEARKLTSIEDAEKKATAIKKAVELQDEWSALDKKAKECAAAAASMKAAKAAKKAVKMRASLAPPKGTVVKPP